MSFLFYIVGFVLTMSFIDKLYKILPNNWFGQSLAIMIIFCPIVNLTVGVFLLGYWWLYD